MTVKQIETCCDRGAVSRSVTGPRAVPARSGCDCNETLNSFGPLMHLGVLRPRDQSRSVTGPRAVPARSGCDCNETPTNFQPFMHLSVLRPGTGHGPRQDHGPSRRAASGRATPCQIPQRADHPTCCDRGPVAVRDRTTRRPGAQQVRVQRDFEQLRPTHASRRAATGDQFRFVTGPRAVPARIRRACNTMPGSATC